MKARASYLLGALLLVKLALMCWSVPRGFDITDEAYHLLAYQYPEADPDLNTHFNRVVDFVFGWMPLTIITSRILRILLDVAGLLALCWGVQSYARKRGWLQQGDRWPLVLFGFLGLGQSLFPRGLYYDYLNMFIVFTAVGLLLLAADQHGWKRIAGVMLAGFLGGWLWMIKFPSAILLSGVMLLAALFVAENRWRGAVVWLLGWGVGMVLAVALFLLGYAGSPAEYWKDYQHGQAVYSMLGYNVSNILIGIYLPDVLETIAIVGTGLGLFLLVRWLTRGKPWAWLAALAGAVLVLLLHQRPTYGFLTYQLQSSALIHTVHLYPLLFTCLLAELLMRRKALAAQGIAMVRLVWLLLLLWVLPYCILMGTDTVFSVSEYVHIAAWFPPLFLLLGVLQPQLPKAVRMSLMSFVVVLATAQFTWFYVFRPYRVDGTLLEQTEWVKGPQESVKVTPEVKQMLEESGWLLKGAGFQPGDSVLAVHDLAGLVYLHGGYPAGTYWYFFAGSSAEYDCHHITKLQEQGRRPWLLVNEASALECLSAFPHYNSHAHYVGEFRDAYQGGNVLIFSPSAFRK